MLRADGRDEFTEIVVDTPCKVAQERHVTQRHETPRARDLDPLPGIDNACEPPPTRGSRAEAVAAEAAGPIVCKIRPLE